ncbi:MAG: hypothetical protein H0X40_11770 [Chthoniobacterales bacterium]|nr:hypothetical protein [Chthoniobacterales bacterium]
MAETIIKAGSDELEETFALSSKWLTHELAEQTKRRIAQKPVDSAEINLYAEVRQGDTRSVLQVAKWKPSDLYGYSDAPRIDLLNVFGDLLQVCNVIANSSEAVEFELKTIDLWQQLRNLNRFFGISAAHDELIATLLSLPTGARGVLDERKVSALQQCFSLLMDSINVADGSLDAVEDLLEHSDFDLQAPMVRLPSVE